MSILRDIVDIFKDLAGGTDDAKRLMNKERFSSISKKSMDGTLQFPVLISTSLDMETSQIVARALEKRFASFVQITLSMNPFMNLQDEKSIADYLRKYHQNTDVRFDFLDASNNVIHNLVDETYSIMVNENFEVLTIIHEGKSGIIFEDNKRLLKEYGSDLNMNIANECYKPDFNYMVTGKISREMKDKYSYSNILESRGRTTPYQNNDSGEEITLPRDVLKWNQTQKLNDLMPTHLTIKTRIISGTDTRDIEYVIGIKSVLHPIATDDMVDNVVEACKGNSKVFSFIRWTTGEIRFFKDFLFNIEGIKKDVTRRGGKESKWWSTLKRRSTLAKIKNIGRILGKQILPNTTLVVSMDEVDYIKNEFKYDIMNLSFIDRVMKQYFLLGLVVVDNSDQTAHFLFDGHTQFESHTFEGLKKEASDPNTTKLLDIMRQR